MVSRRSELEFARPLHREPTRKQIARESSYLDPIATRALLKAPIEPEDYALNPLTQYVVAICNHTGERREGVIAQTVFRELLIPEQRLLAVKLLKARKTIATEHTVYRLVGYIYRARVV